jgi:hypothetical protein
MATGRCWSLTRSTSFFHRLLTETRFGGFFVV